MRAYFLALASGTIAALLAIGAINWVVDPYGVYGSPRIEGFNRLKPAMLNHSDLSKSMTTSREPWEALIIGTSRAEVGLDTTHPAFHGRRCFNAATGGQVGAEGLRMVRAALHNGALKQVVALVDFGIFNETYAGHYDEDDFRPWRGIGVAFNGDTLLQSLLTPLRQDQAALIKEHVIWTEDGRLEYPPPPRGHRERTLVNEASYLHKDYFPLPRRVFVLPPVGQSHFEEFRRLVALAHADRLQLAIVIPPAHARHSEVIAAAGLWPAWEEWQRRLVAIRNEEARKAGQPPFPLWDFSGYNSITTEPFPPLADLTTRMKWYWESSHFTEAAGDLVLDRIAGFSNPALPADFGVQLAAENLEPHLARVRASQLTWRAAHPEDVAEIEALAATSARWRASRRAAAP